MNLYPYQKERELLRSLAERQRQVLERIALGVCTKQIATVMGISTKTVGYHRKRLQERTGFFDIATMTRFAIRAGLIEA